MTEPPTTTPTRHTAAARIALVPIALLALSLLTGPAAGDDRDFFKAADSSPYVFMLLDTSGSMTWAFDNGRVPARGDDPSSKLYQAKSAVYEVVQGAGSEVRFGFAHFRSANPAYRNKRWLYRRADTVTDSDLPWFDSLPFPAAGLALDFGEEFFTDGDGDGRLNDLATDFIFPLRLKSGTFDQKIAAACADPDAGSIGPDDAADNQFRLERMAFYSKLGREGDETTYHYTKREEVSGGDKYYEVIFHALTSGEKPYTPALGDLGAGVAELHLNVQIDVNRYTISGGICTPVLAERFSSTVPLVPHYQQDTADPPLPLSGPSGYFGMHNNNRLDLDIGRTRDFLLGQTTCNSSDTGAARKNSPWWGENAYWEPNANGLSKGTGSYEPFADPYARNCPNGCLDRGDLIPWDWLPPDGSPGFEQTGRGEILFHLAPNLSLPGATSPDFRVAPYLEDTKSGGLGGRLSLRPDFDPAQRAVGASAKYPPIMASSNTPLGGTLENFSDWHDDWLTLAGSPEGDPDLSCRPQYAILLTDGRETCATDGPAAAATILSKEVRTFVVGFGEGVTADDLDGIADAGGTGSVDTDADGLPDCLQFNTCAGAPATITAGDGVIIAENRDDLVDALQNILGVLELTPSTFSTAAIPTAQARAQDSIVLTSFQPLSADAVWPGTTNHFLQPVPLILDFEGNLKPDSSIPCTSSKKTGCLAWEAGERLLSQAPDPTVVVSDRQIGNGSAQRRLFYSMAKAGDNVPRTQQLFDYPVFDDPAEDDLWLGLGLTFDPLDAASRATARAEAEAIIRKTVEIKTVLDPRIPSGLVTIDYVLGDSFHAEPLFTSSPERFFYLANDLEGNGKSCTDTVEPNKGYRCFFERHVLRRHLLLLNSNDGQLHAFDAGSFEGTVQDGKLVGSFTFGTGNELWSHIPREMLDHLRLMKQQPTTYDFGYDGRVVVDDVFLDPVHTGTPNPADREWRTIALSGFREGGRGYEAVDFTQPDHLAEVTVDDFAGNSVTRFVPQTGSDYVPLCSSQYSTAECGPLPYPSVLWEFHDLCAGNVPCDDDANGRPDLGYSWSKPNTGRVQVRVGAGFEVRYVAIFGGGMDPALPDLVGNFLYMVDIETGKVLYKRQLTGSAPSEPAAVDTDQNGLLDTVYIGTTAGFMYKVDISAAADVDAVTGRLDDLTQWVPFAVFDTGGREIFFPPAVVFVGSLGQYALGFGTGDREDLWQVTNVEGRFYMILDQGFTAMNLASPLTELDFAIIARDDPEVTANLLTSPAATDEPGWVLRLTSNERVTAEAFTLSGLLAFNTFSPTGEDLLNEVFNPCIPRGISSVFAILTTNANALGDAARSHLIEGFAGTPYVLPSSLSSSDFEDTGLDPFDATEIQEIREDLKGLFPSNCRFGNFSLRVGASISNTAQVAVAEIPVCVVIKNWTEE